VPIVSDAKLLAGRLERTERDIRIAWYDLLDWLAVRWTQSKIAAAIARGDLTRLYADMDRAAAVFAQDLGAMVITSGQAVAGLVARAIGAPFSFEASAEPAIQFLRAQGLRIVREITEEQRGVFVQVISRGISTGTNPREVARGLRASLGLTRYQEQIVSNYRRALEQGSSNALDRALRDRRFDRAVENAVRGEIPLTRAQIDLMTERYRQRWIKYRAETIARTEALRSVHQAAEETYRQAVERGDLDPTEIRRKWLAGRPPRTRESHTVMNGQLQPYGAPFVSGDGYHLRYPGDPSAPAAETVNCRCVIVTRLEAAPV